MIKYKGHTSNLLAQLSLLTADRVDLKLAEDMLSDFFYMVMNGLSIDEKIRFISGLPAWLKPFCCLHRKEVYASKTSLSPEKLTNVLMTIRHHLSDGILLQIGCCLSTTLPFLPTQIEKENYLHV